MKTKVNAQTIDRSIATQVGGGTQPNVLQRQIDSSQRMAAAIQLRSQLQSKLDNKAIASPLVAQRVHSTRVNFFTSSRARFAREVRRNQVVGGRNIATARVDINGVGTRYVTKISKGVHSEARIHNKVNELKTAHGAANVNVRWLYSELKPCGPDYHNCRHRVGQWFPGVPVFHSIDYTKRKLGVTSAIAKRRRARASATLKRFNTRVRQQGLGLGRAAMAAPVATFRPPLRRVNSDPNLSAGF